MELDFLRAGTKRHRFLLKAGKQSRISEVKSGDLSIRAIFFQSVL